jgi:diguanylate cyclase (GGDEF)-like protein
VPKDTRDQRFRTPVGTAFNPRALPADEKGMVDALTGLPDRRSYQDRLEIEVERARRFRTQLTLCRLRLGGPAGDCAVRKVASILRGGRRADEVFRIGGEEFAVLLPQTDVAGARVAADRIAQRVEAEVDTSVELGLSYRAL